MAIRGDEPLKIKQRAGHRSFSTTEGYIREAEQVGAAIVAVFPALPASIYSAGPWILLGSSASQVLGKRVEAPGIELGRATKRKLAMSRGFQA
jgi:hypothetical protein